MDQHLRAAELMPPGFKIETLETTEGEITISICPRTTIGICPACGRESRAVHSRYARRVADLPWVVGASPWW